MCTNVLIDANFLSRVTTDKPLLEWIRRGHGIVVYTDSKNPGYGQELERVRAARMYMKSLSALGKSKIISDQEIDNVNLPVHFPDGQSVRSNDEHILKLVIAGGAEILCTEDRNLQEDHKSIRGKVNGRSRSVYPGGQADSKRRKFLQERRCSKRL